MRALVDSDDLGVFYEDRLYVFFMAWLRKDVNEN